MRLLALLLLFVPLGAGAQARLAVYAEGGAENSRFNGDVWTKAAAFGAYARLYNLGPLALAGDARAILATDTQTYLFGPRLAAHLPLIPVKPYAEILVGALRYHTLESQAASNIVVRYAAGLDTTVLPRIDWRVAELTYGHVPTEPTTTRRLVGLQTGIVLRF